MKKTASDKEAFYFRFQRAKIMKTDVIFTRMQPANGSISFTAKKKK